MASQIVKTPAVGTPLIRLRQNFHSRRTIDSQHSRGSCACRLSASHSEITTTDKALRGAAAAFLSFSLFTCQPASADLNRFEAAAGGEFGVGTAAQFGEAELRGKDFSGQVLLHVSHGSTLGLLAFQLVVPLYTLLPWHCQNSLNF